ncbi:DUF2062 domain-containing protein [Flavobacteriaceae bacterium TP-CH-4]|uniref:DUF2062 domain-containing protein n=1 Tax=Pelagihabitans pacificus TaxID=2696054 RepID=A0A967E7E3_9FLAO|nr:DUF2062 domain-containing protein [Pelagihabitans pacificus]NHF60555.1 DUF2062 domain-containing protein [Pelagihabitans pacificus]
MKRLHCCVLVPTYNNAGTLQKVLDNILRLTSEIIVVNDGATDGTANILKNYKQIHQIRLPENKGKGNALKVGFKKALDLGYEYAITIDSDGQHFPEDIPVFLKTLEKSESKNILLIGARNMDQSDVPGKSSFGNKFSNFWFWFETGKRLKDTQCGFRLYPLKEIEKLSLRTPKFEFEIEVIVKASWNGTLVENVPVKISYDEDERVSHFRTVPDFARISVLNTWFVIVALFYIKPRNFFRKIRKKGFKKFLIEDVLHHNDSPKKKALSIALGVFIGVSPFWGFQTLLVLFLAVFLKLNKAIAFAFSNVSIPPFIPFIVYGSVQLGMLLTGEQLSFSMDNPKLDFEVLKHLKTYVIGSFALAAIAAALFGFIGYVTLMAKRKMAIDNG